MQNILQVERQEKSRQRITHRDDQQADDTEAEATNLEQLQIDEWTFSARLMRQKCKQAGEKHRAQHDLRRTAYDLLRAPVKDEHQYAREREQQRGAKVVDGAGMCRRWHRAPSHVHPRQNGSRKSHRNQQVKTPAPTEIIDHQAADARPKNETDMMRRGHESLRPPGEILGHRLRRPRPARRLEHRAADALDKTCENQLYHGLGQAAEPRADRENQKAERKHLLPPPQIRDASEDDRKTDIRKLV